VKRGELTARIERTRVVVVGDPCLDENVYGRVETVAKEAPVLALEAEERVYAPGQAANVAANVAALGAQVSFAGIIGPDEQGACLVALLEELGADVGGLVREEGRPTTHKVKFVGREPQRHDQHLFHAYRQVRTAPSPASAKKLRAFVTRAFDAADALVLSDYGNGVLGARFARWLTAESEKRGVVSVVNARGDLAKFGGAAAAVANIEELERAAGRASAGGPDLAAAMEVAASKLQIERLVITAGSEGMAVWPVRGGVARLKPEAESVVDVTGAGDTVTAALAVVLGAGANLITAARIANRAAAAVVTREGTAVARAADIA
jgi:D-beta-D-heptose 7-phosphate kinase/D-beta-D-heptose 1-phosphate adenosyltransferase